MSNANYEGGQHIHSTDGIDINNRHEIEYWCNRFGCTEQELKLAVGKVGVTMKDVEAELKRLGARS